MCARGVTAYVSFQIKEVRPHIHVEVISEMFLALLSVLFNITCGPTTLSSHDV